MAKKGENIYRRKDGRWEGRYVKGRIDGKIKYGYVFAKTYKEVKQKLILAQTPVPEQKILENPDKKEETCEKFSVVAMEWLVLKETQCKPSSIARYNNVLKLHLFPQFSNRKIDEITRDDVITFSNQLLATEGDKAKGLAPKTVSGIISVMNNIFQYATKVKAYSVSDIKGITIKQSQKTMRILSIVEQEKLSRYLYENLTPCNLGILLCLYTGLRIGEICALKWEDISFKEQYLHVYKTMQRLQNTDKKVAKTTILTADPKSGSSVRTVPIPDEIFQLLKKERKPAHTFILTGKEKEYIEPRTMQNRFKSVAKHCQIETVNFHALRHTFATRCVELGFDAKSLSEILGHSSVNITLNRYVHPSMELKQKNMNRLSKLFAVK